MPASRLTAAIGSATLLALLLSAFHIEGLTPLATVVLLALAALSWWRPDVGLLLVAAALPVASWTGRLLTVSGQMWPSAVIAAFGCGYLARRAAEPADPAPDRTLRTATLVLAAIVTASLLVQLSVLLERLGAQGLREQLWGLAGRDFLIVDRSLPGISTAALLLEGLLLFYAGARLTATSERFRRMAPGALVLGAAVAAAINLWRMLEVIARSENHLGTTLRFLTSQRINEHFADMNAAGSYFVLAFWLALGLSWRGRGRGWTLAAMVIGAGLWMTGSRTAVLAGLVAAALPLLLAGGRLSIRRAWIAGACVVLLAAGGAIAVAMPERGNQQSAVAALQVRIGLTETALRMVRARPLFGVGVGEFYQRSGEFSTPALLALFPPARNENAHNNFLQILAELGVAGFAAFVWLLLLAGQRFVSTTRASGSAATAGAATGVFAFLLTCLAGHPLLIPEVAGAFWLALGLTAATPGTPTQPPTASPASTRWLWAGVLALALTLPLRARQQLAETDFEHVGIGLSAWQRTDENERYRIMAGSNGTVFAQGNAGSVTVPLRTMTGTPPLDVEVRLDGRLANVVHVGAEQWTSALVVMPGGGNGVRFRRLDLSVLGEHPPAGALLVGKVIPH